MPRTQLPAGLAHPDGHDADATPRHRASRAQHEAAAAALDEAATVVLEDPPETQPHMKPVPDAKSIPAVSIVIVSYNCREALRACLRSLEEERASTDIEVIVVDNASKDETGYTVATEFPWVKLIVNRTNVGFAHAVNEGLKYATADFFLLLNPDTIVRPHTLARTLTELERQPKVGMLGCKLVRPDGSFDHACKRGFPTVLSALYYFTGLARRFPDSPRFAQYTASHLGVNDTGTVDAINGAFMLVRRAAVEDVGELDERYWLWAEDLDWCHRFWEQGWEILYWPEAEVVHLKGASVGSHRSLRLNYAFHKSIWLFYAKYHAPRRTPLLTGLVAMGVWSKFIGSAAANAARRLATTRPADA